MREFPECRAFLAHRRDRSLPKPTVSDLEATCTFYDVADQGYVIDRLA